MSDKLTVKLPDGSERPLVKATFDISYSTKVSLDGMVLDVGIAHQMLLTYREWAAEEIDRLTTELADWKAHQAHCPLAQQEAGEKE